MTRPNTDKVTRRANVPLPNSKGAEAMSAPSKRFANSAKSPLTNTANTMREMPTTQYAHRFRRCRM